ncbi:MAG TPA: class I SAM-dependent methyltransferase [Burkholderiaceae bacterium]|jgi:SAM-dependent methyltransferase|nr:class I SAM-dependent methyltransferase [Burkholderiaceae bacterium]
MDMKTESIMAQSQASKPDYGLDAPGVVRNLFLCAAAGLLVWASVKIGLWSGIVSIPISNDTLNIEFTGMGLGFGIGLSFTGFWMIWDSKIGKLRGREELLGKLQWSGNEQVLDLGCGRGLLLIGAAKRLTTGKATGIDIWQTEDLSGNSQDATMKNIQLEGVVDRTEIKTADMRELPFADGTMDVVVSRAAIHNLYSKADRARAIKEVIRVLKPGGRALIEDIRHGNEYATVFSEHGCSNIQRLGSAIIAFFAMLVTAGSLRPTTLLVTKSISA